jgi:hypothetical protein
MDAIRKVIRIYNLLIFVWLSRLVDGFILSVSRLAPLWRRDICPQSHLWLSRKGITQGFSLRFMEGVIRLTKVETFFLVSVFGVTLLPNTNICGFWT